MSFSSAAKGESSPPSAASCLTFHGHSVVIAVSAPANSAAIEKRKNQIIMRTTSCGCESGPDESVTPPALAASARRGSMSAPTSTLGSRRSARLSATAPRPLLRLLCCCAWTAPPATGVRSDARRESARARTCGARGDACSSRFGTRVAANVATIGSQRSNRRVAIFPAMMTKKLLGPTVCSSHKGSFHTYAQGSWRDHPRHRSGIGVKPAYPGHRCEKILRADGGCESKGLAP